MYKVVINICFGGFSLSKEASEYLNEKYNMGINPEYGFLPYFDDDGYIPRHDKRLIEVIEALGEERASGRCSELAIVEISTPCYRIDEYDGMESVETPEGIEWEYIHKGE